MSSVEQCPFCNSKHFYEEILNNIKGYSCWGCLMFYSKKDIEYKIKGEVA